MGKGKVGESCDLERGKWGVSRTWIRELRLSHFSVFFLGFYTNRWKLDFGEIHSEGEPANEGRRKREESLMRGTGD